MCATRQLVVLAALILTAAAARADDRVSIAWSHKVGDTFYLQHKIIQEQTREVNGRKKEGKSETSSLIRFKVRAVQAAGEVLEMQYLDITVSAQDRPAKLIEAKSRFAGTSMTVTVDRTLNVTYLEGYDGFLDKLSRGEKPGRKQLETIVPESAVRQVVTAMFVPTPGKPVKIGDSWEKTGRVQFGGLGEMTTDAKFTLKGIKDGAATVGVGGAATLKLSEGGGRLPFKVIKSDLKVEAYSGQYVFDLQAGRARESSTELLATGKYTIESDGQKTDIAIRQSQKTVIAISYRNPLDN